jgi:hypothetical protein
MSIVYAAVRECGNPIPSIVVGDLLTLHTGAEVVVWHDPHQGLCAENIAIHEVAYFVQFMEETNEVAAKGRVVAHGADCNK